MARMSTQIPRFATCVTHNLGQAHPSDQSGMGIALGFGFGIGGLGDAESEVAIGMAPVVHSCHALRTRRYRVHPSTRCPKCLVLGGGSASGTRRCRINGVSNAGRYHP